MTAITLRPETAEDDAFLRRLNMSVRWNEFARLGLPPAQLRALLDQQCELRRVHYRSQYPDADFAVIDADDVPVGRLYVQRGATEFLLVDIAILPDRARRGLGTQLLSTLLADAAAAGCDVVLSVDCFSPAQRLYRRLGFVAEGENGADILMRWRAPPQPNTAS